jgi:hypothetical protein
VRCADAGRHTGTKRRPGAIAAGNRDLTTKLTHEPNNVMDYRFVKD